MLQSVCYLDLNYIHLYNDCHLFNLNTLQSGGGPLFPLFVIEKEYMKLKT